MIIVGTGGKRTIIGEKSSYALKKSATSFTYIKNINGPNNEPCGRSGFLKWNNIFAATIVFVDKLRIFPIFTRFTKIESGYIDTQ